MIEGLGDEIARLLIRYRAHAELFRTPERNRLAFSLSDVIRGMLFNRAVERGLTPFPNISVLNWRIDLACMRGRRLTHLFLLRWNRQQDYRQLLLFPRSVGRVLIAMNPGAIPDQPYDITVLKMTDTTAIRAADRAGLTVSQINLVWEKAHLDTFGVPCPVPRKHRMNAAARLLQLWQTRGAEYDLRGYVSWFMTRQQARDMQRLPRMGEAVHLEVVGEYLGQMDKRDRESAERVTDEWIARGGWGAAE